jgi:uncharacterized paraquat-inducible protein A
MANWCEVCERSDDADICAVCGADLNAADPRGLPWTWKLMIGTTVIYVLWRIYQLITWLAK